MPAKLIAMQRRAMKSGVLVTGERAVAIGKGLAASQNQHGIGTSEFHASLV